jgi:hypothetical protein
MNMVTEIIPNVFPRQAIQKSDEIEPTGRERCFCGKLSIIVQNNNEMHRVKIYLIYEHFETYRLKRINFSDLVKELMAN